MRTMLAGLALGLVVTGGASAQDVIDDPQANVVEALVVNAKLPGPAWWRVSDADTTVYVLGVPNALPKGLVWDTSVLDNRLKGAFAYITPPVARAGITDLPALLKLRKALKAERPLEQTSPALAARMGKAWAAADPKKPDEWREWKPLGSAIMLGGRAARKADIQTNEPEKAIGRLVKKHKVKTRSAATYKAMPMLKAVARQHTEQAGLSCLEEVLDDVEAGPEPIRRAARAWAEGKPRAALAAGRGADRCEMLLPGVPDLIRQATADEVSALADALKTPGHAVAVYSLRGLVAEGGVLDQLRAKGVTVRTPAD